MRLIIEIMYRRYRFKAEMSPEEVDRILDELFSFA